MRMYTYRFIGKIPLLYVEYTYKVIALLIKVTYLDLQT